MTNERAVEGIVGEEMEDATAQVNSNQSPHGPHHFVIGPLAVINNQTVHFIRF